MKWSKLPPDFIFLNNNISKLAHPGCNAWLQTNSHSYGSKTKLHAGDRSLFDDPFYITLLLELCNIIPWLGRVLYLSLTRSANLCTPHSQNQWDTVKCILQYLKLTMHHQLVIPHSSNLVLHAFTNSYWASYLDDRKFTSGYTIFLWNILISWPSKKKWIVAFLSTKSEYKALSDAIVVLTWLEFFLFKLNILLLKSSMLWWIILVQHICL